MAPPETAEETLTRAIRYTLLRALTLAAAPTIVELSRAVEGGKLTVPAACRRLRAALPDFSTLAADVLAQLTSDPVTADPVTADPVTADPVTAAAKRCRSKTPAHCRVHGVPLKKNQPRYLGGIDPRHAREHKTPGETVKVYRLNQHQTMHKQVSDLADIITRASSDGTHLHAVLTRPEFGTLTLDCGRPGRKNDPAHSGGHGVKHALEERHNISPHDIAETLLLGSVSPDPKYETRLHVSHNDYVVVLEREMYPKAKRDKNRGEEMRLSNTKAKLLTAMKRERRRKK